MQVTALATARLVVCATLNHSVQAYTYLCLVGRAHLQMGSNQLAVQCKGYSAQACGAGTVPTRDSTAKRVVAQRNPIFGNSLIQIFWL